MPRTFAIGDIHGCSKTLDALLNQLKLTSEDTLIILGDMIDRGPDSKGVLNILMDAGGDLGDFILLAGNHELMWMSFLGMKLPQFPKGLDFFSDGANLINNFQNAASTMTSFGHPGTLSAFATFEFPFVYKVVLESLMPYYLSEIGGQEYLFLHAGMPSGALRRATAKEAVEATLADCPSSLFWESKTLEVEPSFNATIVHGHVPWQRVKNASSFNFPGVNFGKINLDGGCGYSQGELNPRLVAMEFPSRDVFIQPRID